MGDVEKNHIRSELQDKINGLKKELDGIDTEACKKNIDKLKEKRDYLFLVKKTILFMKEKDELVKADIPSNAEQISVRRMNQSDTTEVNNKAINKNPAMVILMILSAVIAVLFLCSWVELNGYEINLFELLRDAQNLIYMFGSSGETPALFSFLWFVCIIQCIFTVSYIYIIYELYKKGESSALYPCIFGTIIIFLIFWIITLSANSEIDDIYSGLSNYFSTRLTWKAWGTLIFAFVSVGIYSKQEEINERLFGISVESNEENIRKIPVVNFYPWEEIRFTDAIMNKGKRLAISLQYTIPSAWRSKGYIERWNSSIVVAVDIILKVFRKEYVINNLIFNVAWEHVKGTTEKIVMDNYTLNINDIDEVRVMIRTIEMPDEKKRELHQVYAISNMSSSELQRYRQQINYEDAMCREEKFETGWRCSCGLIHDEMETKCMNCGSALSQDGKFIR